MGLDNGIMISGINREDIPTDIFCLFPFTDMWKENGENDVCYWRKCWGIRNEIFSVISNTRDCGDYELSYNDIEKIIEVIKRFTRKSYWEENADSIWEFKYFKGNLHNQIKVLKWLLEEMGKNENIKVKFYDSY